MIFRRPESLRERTLLRLIEQQQHTIRDLTDRLMYATGRSWNLPPHPENTTVPAEWQPDEWTATPEQEPKY